MVLVLFTSIAADIVLTVAQELVKWMVSGAKWNWLNLAFILFVLCFPFLSFGLLRERVIPVSVFQLFIFLSF